MSRLTCWVVSKSVNLIQNLVDYVQFVCQNIRRYITVSAIDMLSVLLLFVF
ncbi:unnamed protein product [Callosobruchus maculatus]|uniref:Uncharacterized protein n=1 Tax=Callosobruchus maculatus TaxID=64391 RepID=A0A653BJB6_CALMS|nr:unnamed protein product [Callosobruchus maculatus]